MNNHKQSTLEEYHEVGKSQEFHSINSEGDIYEEIFRHCPIPIIVHDLEMKIINANKSALKEFGYSKEELIQKKVYDLHPKEEIKHSNEVLKKMKTTKKLSEEGTFKRKDGSLFVAYATPCKYKIGDEHIIHAYIQDITEHKNSQIKLNRLNQNLDSEIKRNKLYAQRLEKKNKELEDFGYVAAHDLRAPVINLSTLASMVNVHKMTDAENILLFNKLNENIQALQDTVLCLNEVVNFRFLLNVKKDQLNFNKVFNEVKKSLAGEIYAKKASFQANFSACPEIEYPLLHLKSIMQNMLSNALKFSSPNRPLKVDVKTFKEGKSTCLEIKDNGLGFNAKNQNIKMFDLFTRLHAEVEGKGIGLYLVKTIIDSHDGKIEVTSEPDKGAIFKLFLNNKDYE